MHAGKVYTYFLMPGKSLCRVCTAKHKDPSTCKKAHAVPAGAIWSGEWEYDFVGDLVWEVVKARKVYYKARRKWKRDLEKLNAKSVAPAFAAWHKKAIADHMAAEPTFRFTPRARPSSTQVA